MTRSTIGRNPNDCENSIEHTEPTFRIRFHLHGNDGAAKGLPHWSLKQDWRSSALIERCACAAFSGRARA